MATTMNPRSRRMRQAPGHLDDRNRPFGDCPVCAEPVHPHPTAVRYRKAWYHVRCALDREEQAEPPSVVR
jgi:hypothetical protein